jgi:hypothetical protein
MKISVHFIFHVIRYIPCMKQYPNSTITSFQKKLFFSCSQWIISSHHCHHSDSTFSRECCLEDKRCKMQAEWVCKACAGWGWTTFGVWLLMWPGRGTSLICLWFCLAYTSIEVVQNADVLFRADCWFLRQEACQHCWMSQGTLEKPYTRRFPDWEIFLFSTVSCFLVTDLSVITWQKEILAGCTAAV